MDRLTTAAHCLSRRRFLQGSVALAGLGLLSGCSRLSTQAQSPKVRRIGMLEGSDVLDVSQFAPFRDRLSELGYVEGDNLVIEKRFARNDPSRFPDLIAELEAAGVETIVCGGMQVCLAVKEANPPIPTVAWIPASDPVVYGLVQSIARPEGNITGIAGPEGQLMGTKLLENLKEIVPGAGRIGVLAPARWPLLDATLQGLKDAASLLKLHLEIREIDNPSGIEPAILDLKAAGAGAVFIIPGTMFIAPDIRARTAELLRVHRLPSASSDTAMPRVGGFLAYSPNRTDAASRVAWYVDQALKGAKPADLPMQRPSKYDLVINLKTAEALGITIPQVILDQTTETIQ